MILPIDFSKRMAQALAYGNTPITRVKGNPITNFRAFKNSKTSDLYFFFIYEQEFFGRNVNHEAVLILSCALEPAGWQFLGITTTDEAYLCWFPLFVLDLDMEDQFDIDKFLLYYEPRTS